MNRNGGVNKVMLVGRINTEPDTITTNNGTCLNFILLTEEDIGMQKGKIPHTEYHNVLIPDSVKLPDRTLLKVGCNVFIQGKIQTLGFTDEGHIRRYKTNIIANQAELI